MWFILFFILAVESTKIHFETNPGCPPTKCKNSKNNIVYGKFLSHHHSLHYIWSLNREIDYPTLVLIKSQDVESTLVVDWDKYLDDGAQSSDLLGSVSLSGSDQDYSYAVILLKGVSLYKEQQDGTETSKDNLIKSYSFNHLKLNFTLSKEKDKVLLKFTDSSVLSRPTIQVKFEPHLKIERNEKPPLMLFSNTSSELEFTFTNMLSDKASMTLEYDVIYNLKYVPHTNNVNNSVLFLQTTSINDNILPSLLRTEEVTWFDFTPAYKLESTSFFRWRTYAYTCKNATEDTDCVIGAQANSIGFDTLADKSRNRLLMAMFSNKLISNSIKLKFGDQDPLDLKYLKFSTVVGFGSAPVDGYSVVAFSVFVGLLFLPFIVLLSCFVYISVSKSKHMIIASTSGFEPLTDD